MTLDERLAALGRAADRADGRLAHETVNEARATVAKAGGRLGLGVETTVAALAGPTGAGKSSLFNALAGTDLVEVGRRRPTTSSTSAAIWGSVGSALLDWLDVPQRHVLPTGAYDGLVLLDLPDFDSVERTHRREVDRVVALADLLLWVVDPQKYADASLHEHYLRPLAAYEETTAVVLNQSDLLGSAELASCVDDLRRLLAGDGLDDAPVVAVSAVTGEGLDTLRRLLEERVAARTAAAKRLGADVDASVAALLAACGEGNARGVQRDDRERLSAALAEAAGVPTVVRAVAAAHRRRGALATGWPFLRWLRRFRPDPLRRLRLGDEPREQSRTSLPGPSPVHRARAQTAARALAARATDGLPDPWPRLAREAATAREQQLADELDRAVARADLRTRRPVWWRVVGGLQTLLAAAVAAGALWLLALFALTYLQLDDIVPTPEAEGIPLPTALLVGGVVGGVALAFLARLVNGVAARRRARSAERTLRASVDAVARELVVEPVVEELRARDDLRAELTRASARHRKRVRTRT